MSLESDLDRIILKKSLDDFLPKIQPIDGTIREVQELLTSQYPLIELGWSEDGLFFLTEEDCEGDFHILGAKGEGKSKLIELLLRHRIDNGQGACFLDPSDNGDTMYKVLKYAIKKGYERIVIVDPHDIVSSERVPVINPLHYSAPSAAVVGNIMDACRILWAQSSFSDTPRIQKYLPAIISALHAGQFCLPDAEALMSKSAIFKNQREGILLNDDFIRYHRLNYENIDAAFHNAREWDGYLPTVNRLMPFMDRTMKLLFGMREGLDFKKLIAEKYLVLVNLDPEGIWGTGSPEQRLLGTIIINEISYAVSRLRAPDQKHGIWKGVFHLYIDEVGDYATQKLSYILDKKRKSHIRLCVAHQRFDQLDDAKVASAIEAGTKIKIVFNVKKREDRDRMIRMMFGGELSDREVSFSLQDTKSRHCWIKNDKKPPAKVQIKDLPDIDVKQSVLDDFKTKLYASDFYKSVGEIRAETKQRFGKHPKQSTGGGAGQYKQNTSEGDKHQLRHDGDTGIQAGAISQGRTTPRSIPAQPEPPGVQPTLVHKRRKGSGTERKQAMEEDSTEE